MTRLPGGAETEIAEFKEKGINTDKLERVLAESEAEMGAGSENEASED